MQHIPDLRKIGLIEAAPIAVGLQVVGHIPIFLQPGLGLQDKKCARHQLVIRPILKPGIALGFPQVSIIHNQPLAVVLAR